MRRMLQNFSRLNRLPFLAIGSLAGWLLISQTASAQPDDFANAQELFGSWGSVTNDNSGASLEAGEPNHGGQNAGNSIWYKWTAPTDGEVSMDTIGSLGPSGAILDTVIGVYVGNNLSSLTQVAANDESFPLPKITSRILQTFDSADSHYFRKFFGKVPAPCVSMRKQERSITSH